MEPMRRERARAKVLFVGLAMGLAGCQASPDVGSSRELELSAFGAVVGGSGSAAGGPPASNGEATEASGIGASGSEITAPAAPISKTPGEPGGGVPEPSGSAPESGVRDEAAEIAALEAKVAQLEAELAAIPAQKPAPGPLATVEELMASLDARDAQALSREVEQLVLAGEEGFGRLHQYFHQADLDHQKLLALVHEPLLICSLLRVVALHPDEVAELSRYLMKATQDRPESYIRREIYSFVPVFLNHHRGRYPELRAELEQDILHQLDTGGQYFEKIAIAMRNLGFEVPLERLLKLLEDPSKASLHAQLLSLVVARGDDAVPVLLRLVRETRHPELRSVADALRGIARIDYDRKSKLLDEFLSDSRPQVHRAAVVAYFSFPRDETALPLAFEHLNSGLDDGDFRAFLILLRQRNGAFLKLLKERSDSVVSEERRKLLVGFNRSPFQGQAAEKRDALEAERLKNGGEDR